MSYNSNIHSISFEDYSISLESVMRRFEGEGSYVYEDIVEELLEDASSLAAPLAVWRPLSVTHLSDKEIQLADIVISNACFAERLKGVDQVYAFVCTIGEALWINRTAASDPLEDFLYDAIMKTCLDEVFAKTAATIVRELPDKMGLYMDNPGSMAGWGLDGQEMLLGFLKTEAEADPMQEMKLGSGYVFDNKFTISGIIYAKGTQPADCVLCPKENCSHRKTAFDENKLLKRLYQTSLDIQ